MLLYFHPARTDLGAVSHFLVDLATQLRLDILAMEYPGFSASASRSSLSFKDTLLERYVNEFFQFAQNKAGSRDLILFASGEGAIPASMLARAKEDQLLALILEEPLIQFQVRRGFFRQKQLETRFL